ncbi:MAG TPA: hypothetical protein ENI23_14640 [bacterium]|nr:hypothetical protein [bacterium]
MQQRLTTPKAKYSYGPYNKFNKKEQWIRITEGCPHNCPYCFEPQEVKIFDIPEIVRKDVKITDMNILCKKEALGIIKELGDKRPGGKVVYYELVCGIDYRFLTKKIAEALKQSRFKKIRLAWDWLMMDQYKIKEAKGLLLKAGYRKREIMIFIICNWKIPYEICCSKLDLCKVWGLQVADCYFDNQTFPNVIPLHWTDEQNKSFRKKCRKHNQLVNFGIDPEVKSVRIK